MKILLRIITFSFFIICFQSTCEAQTDKNQSIGIQLNPYFDSHLFERTFIKPVFALRYGYYLTKNFTLGPEISGYYITTLKNQTDFNLSYLNLGAFFRYSILPESRVKPFLEISTYYTFYHFKSDDIVTMEGVGKDERKEFLSGYLSPGISVFSKSRRISLDLMYKFSNKYFVNDHKSVFSYRLNINF